MKKLWLAVLIICSTLQNTVAFTADTNRLRLNFLVSSKQKKFDAAPFSFQVQAKFTQLFNKKRMYVIIARSSEDMVKQIRSILEKRKAMIGNIWFDSHGHFTRRRSLFEIGNEEFNCHSIRDTCFTVQFKKLGAYCDTNTNVSIGSCYGGATYTLPAVEEFPAQRMNGDSLMIGLSELLNNSTVYGSESFVLTGPGILSSSYALAGNPLRKKFKDQVYAPVWEKLGEWNCYSGKEKRFEEPVTVTLHPNGSIATKKINYLALEKNKNKWLKKMQQLKSGNYNLAFLYQND